MGQVTKWRRRPLLQRMHVAIPNRYQHDHRRGVDLWRAGLLTSADAGLLKNSDRLSVFVMMNCLNGYFNDPLLDSLAEAMMKAPEGGAVAVWASSAMTTPEGQASMNEELYRQLFRNRGISLGDAIKNAKASVNNSDVPRSWILLGDPTITLR